MAPFSADILLLLIALFLGVSATFSMIEISLLRSRKFMLQKGALRGDKGCAAALRLLEDIELLITTILMWNSFANVVCATLATLLAIQLWEGSDLAVTVSSIMITITILIFAEIAPKQIGMRHADKIASLTGRPLALLVRASGPLARLLQLVTHLLLRLVGIKPKRVHTHRIAADELQTLVVDKHTLNENVEEHKEMLVRLIGLHDLSIRDVMISRSDIKFVNLRDTPEKQLEILFESGYQLVPVCDGNLENIIGIVRASECAAADRLGKYNKRTLRKLTVKPLFVPETIDPVNAIRELISNHTEMALVVTEFGGLIGLATLFDCFKFLLGGETGRLAQNRSVPSDGSFRVRGHEIIRELNLRLALGLPEGRAITIGGLITEILGDFPEYPACVRIGNIGLVAETVSKRRVHTVLIRRLASNDSPEQD